MTAQCSSGALWAYLKTSRLRKNYYGHAGDSLVCTSGTSLVYLRETRETGETLGIRVASRARLARRALERLANCFSILLGQQVQLPKIGSRQDRRSVPTSPWRNQRRFSPLFRPEDPRRKRRPQWDQMFHMQTVR